MAINPAASRAATTLASAATGNGELLDNAQMRPAIVTGIDKTVSPWVCEIEVQTTRYPGITMLGWYDPQLGDRIMVLQQGRQFFILGSMAPGKIYAPATPPPAPPAPPPPPPAPPVIRSVDIAPNGSGTYPAEAPLGGWRTDRLYQSGEYANQRSFWTYGTAIADAKGSGTILGGKVFVKRWDRGGVASGANVRLGGHALLTIGGAPGALSSVSVVGSLLRNQGYSFSIPADIIAGMNSGTIKGLGLEPGVADYESADYLAAYAFGVGQEWSGALNLTIQG